MCTVSKQPVGGEEIFIEFDNKNVEIQTAYFSLKVLVVAAGGNISATQLYFLC